MKATLFLYLVTISVLVNAQDLKRITKSNMHFGEIYYVLKSNKSIKQGKYLKYFESMNMYDKAIECFGDYVNNKKTGVWIFCDAESESNNLVSIGEYKDNKKIGIWVYFYQLDSENKNFVNLSGNNKHTKVTLPTKSNEQINITLDTSGIRIAAKGQYLNDKKSGIWSYYYKNGLLACKYDFSTNSITQNNGLVTFDQLGGIEKFNALFYKSTFENKINHQPFFSENSNVVFELTSLHDSIEIKMVNSIGSNSFAKTMRNILDEIPLEWINYDPRLEENVIKVQIDYTVQGRIGNVKLNSVVPLK